MSHKLLPSRGKLHVASQPIILCSHDVHDVTGKEALATDYNYWLGGKKSNMLVFLLGHRLVS